MPVHFDTASLQPMPPPAFDAMMAEAVPKEVHAEVARVMREGERLWRKGSADRPPQAERWRRQFSMFWLHSRDLTVLMQALGYPKPLTGVHDLTETVLGRHLKSGELRGVDGWYERWIHSLDEREEVVIGMFNPHLAASFWHRGAEPGGGLNASHAHLMSDHHLGTPDQPVDLVEQAANWVVHQLPREHLGVHHQPIAEWSELDARLQNDAVAQSSEVLRCIARDAAALLELLEREGKVVPWHLLRVPV